MGDLRPRIDERQGSQRMKDTRDSPAARTPESSRIASFFDDMSKTRNEIFRTNPILEYEQQVRSAAVLKRLQARHGEAILDIGCGNARDILPILSQGATIVGVDLSEGMIDQARRDLADAGHRDVRLEVGDATRLQFGAGTFDKVLCSEVIEHIPDAALAVSEMCRVLRPGGTLVISTPNRRSWYGFDRYVISDRILRKPWNHPFDNWRTMEELTALLSRNGFDVTTAETVCYLPGFALTYFLPQPLQAVVASTTRRMEGIAAATLPRNGYLLVVTARKRG